MIVNILKKWMKIADLRLLKAMRVSVIGILCNLFLFALKLSAGLMMHSIAIVSDGFNNLSDAFSCFITLFGYQLSSKPADQEHPFGHGRMEYIVSFISAMIIFSVTYELFTKSLQKVIHPEVVVFHLPLFVLLCASVFVKIWLAGVDEKTGKEIDSIALMTAAQDSRNDVFVTSVSMLGMLLSVWKQSVSFDGIVGVLLSLYLFYAVFGIAKDIISRILGNPVSHELMQQIETQILQSPQVLGVHDLMIHEYGAGVRYGSGHVEVESHMELLKAHDLIDRAERQIQEKYHVTMTLHIDPIVLDDPKVNEYRKLTETLLKEIHPSLTMHDFRLVPGSQHDNLIYDVLIPYSCKLNREDVLQALSDGYQKDNRNVHLHVTFDHDFSDKQ